MSIVRDVRINREIRAKEARVIDPEGKQLGVIPLLEALRIAAGFELDLVEVSSKSDPPVCRIMDYGKFLYEQSKKIKAAKKKQHTVQLKEVRFRPKTEEHDYSFKLTHIKEFLADGFKVKISIVFRGREMVHKELGHKILDRLIVDLKEVAEMEGASKQEGRNLSAMFLAKKK
jgi:translation initiation factor IF-3